MLSLVLEYILKMDETITLYVEPELSSGYFIGTDCVLALTGHLEVNWNTTFLDLKIKYSFE